MSSNCNNNEKALEDLENRRLWLKDNIEKDRKNFNDACLSQHSRGRVAIEETWLIETEKLIEELRK